ncbi:MAG: hypothetical protein CM1200mP30_32910 [Pseudomonadota bacterium]|nr:MAG: hypothetical protein CM1200mP30_32910 [Pseudomonadota bacterium]
MILLLMGVFAERSLLTGLEGNCQIPLAGYCINTVRGNDLKSALCDPEGKSLIEYEARAQPHKAVSLGKKIRRMASEQWRFSNFTKVTNFIKMS